MSRKTQITIHILTAIMLIVCLFDMPYGYYQLVRFIVMCVFALSAYEDYKNSLTKFAILNIVLALLFQPFLKIELGRALWNVIDVIVAIYLSYRVVKLAKQ